MLCQVILHAVVVGKNLRAQLALVRFFTRVGGAGVLSVHFFAQSTYHSVCMQKVSRPHGHVGVFSECLLVQSVSHISGIHRVSHPCGCAGALAENF